MNKSARVLQGIRTRDIPLVRAVVLIVGLAFVLTNLGVDILYSFLDPRIRYEESKIKAVSQK